MFDPKNIKAGEVIEFLSGSTRETLRGLAASSVVENPEPHIYVDVLLPSGRPTGFQNRELVYLTEIIGYVDGGPLVDLGRKDWDRYFMDIASQAASRATCDRKHVGAAIVADKIILSTGYNGSIRGVESCRERGHMMEDGHCVRTVHAEANAIIQAARKGIAVEGAKLYTTASPCWWCFKLIANAGITHVVFGELYRDKRIWPMAKRCGIQVKVLYPAGTCEKCGGDPDDRHDHD